MGKGERDLGCSKLMGCCPGKADEKNIGNTGDKKRQAEDYKLENPIAKYDPATVHEAFHHVSKTYGTITCSIEV